MIHLADVIIPGRHFGATSDRSDAAEAFVMLTLGFLLGVLLAFAIAGFILWRRHKNPAPHHQLLMELDDDEQEEAKPTAQEPKPERNPWEKDADWWKE